MTICACTSLLFPYYARHNWHKPTPEAVRECGSLGEELVMVVCREQTKFLLQWHTQSIMTGPVFSQTYTGFISSQEKYQKRCFNSVLWELDQKLGWQRICDVTAWWCMPSGCHSEICYEILPMPYCKKGCSRDEGFLCMVPWPHPLSLGMNMIGEVGQCDSSWVLHVIHHCHFFSCRHRGVEDSAPCQTGWS